MFRVAGIPRLSCLHGFAQRTRAGMTPRSRSICRRHSCRLTISTTDCDDFLLMEAEAVLPRSARMTYSAAPTDANQQARATIKPLNNRCAPGRMTVCDFRLARRPAISARSSGCRVGAGLVMARQEDSFCRPRFQRFDSLACGDRIEATDVELGGVGDNALHCHRSRRCAN